MQTYGWDLVCAIRADRVNESLQTHLQQNPLSVDYSDGDVRVNAAFATLEVVAGGADKLLHVQFQVGAGTISLGDRQWSVAETKVVVEIQLAFMDHADLSHVQDLRFHLAVAGRQPGDTTDGAVSLVTSIPGDGVDPQAARAFSDHVVECLLANRGRLAYAFASVNLRASGTASWMAPERCTYCYLPGRDSKQPGYLAILGLLRGQWEHQFELADPSQRVLPERHVDPALLDQDSPLCIAVSPLAFLQNVVAPALPAVYGHGITVADFMTSGADADEVPATGTGYLVRIPLREMVLEHNGSSMVVKPDLTRISVTVEDADLVTAIEGSAPLLKSSRINLTYRARGTFNFDVSTGRASLTSAGTPTATSEPEYSHEDMEIMAEESLRAGPLGSALANALTESIRGLASELSGNLVSDLGELRLSQWLPEAVAWTDSSGWSFKHAGLADAFFARANAI